jgi:hypothetical protein
MGETGAKPFKAKIDRQTSHLPKNLRAAVQASLAEWQRNEKVRRLWASDASLARRMSS